MNRHTRLTALLDLILEREEVRVEDIVETLAISPATARRDLDTLAQQQLITRTRGGARLHPGSSDLPLRYKTGRDAEEKSRIARAAVQLVQPGEVVGLNGGTTTTEVGRELALLPESSDPACEPRLTVVTNAVNIANELTTRPRIKVVVTGGVARPHSYELTGPLDAEKAHRLMPHGGRVRRDAHVKEFFDQTEQAFEHGRLGEVLLDLLVAEGIARFFELFAHEGDVPGLQVGQGAFGAGDTVRVRAEGGQLVFDVTR